MITPAIRKTAKSRDISVFVSPEGSFISFFTESAPSRTDSFTSARFRYSEIPLKLLIQNLLSYTAGPAPALSRAGTVRRQFHRHPAGNSANKNRTASRRPLSNPKTGRSCNEKTKPIPSCIVCYFPPDVKYFFPTMQLFTP